MTRRPKYGNRRTVVDGVAFASAAEARRWQELRLLEQAGQISELQRQPRYPLDVARERVGVYVGDFWYVRKDRPTIEDVKGVRTPLYRLKAKLVHALYGLTITEVEAWPERKRRQRQRQRMRRGSARGRAA